MFINKKNPQGQARIENSATNHHKPSRTSFIINRCLCWFGRRRRRAFAVNISLIFTLTTCAGLVQKSGEILDGNAFEEKTLAVYNSIGTNFIGTGSAGINSVGASPVGKDNKSEIELRSVRRKNGEESLEISSVKWPGLVLRLSIPGNDGHLEFREARFLSSHVHGWNEFSIEIIGSAVFSTSGEIIGLFRIADKVERVQITSGKIRLKSSRYTGNTALTSLQNRRERILALIEWMDEVSGGLVYADRNEFDNYWKPRLFPELVSKARQPSEYSAENAEWVKADSIKWNKTYTEQIMNEELWELRNSGGLLRDWEEALPWIYMEYSWNNIISSLNDINLIKIE